MGEGPWDLWRGTDSLLERFVDGKSASLEGTGILKLEEEEDAWKFEAPEGPGQVRFALLCDFEEFKSPSAEAIKVRLQSRDDPAFKIIRGGHSGDLSPLPRYRLSGSIFTEQGEIPVQMDAVTIDDRTFGLTEREITKVAPVRKVTVGSLESTSDLVSCKMIVPNFIDEATVEGGGVRITLSKILPETTNALCASECRGKVLPGSYLEVQRLREDAGESVELVVDDIGWLLSFYAGRRIHPLTWEGETTRGSVWHIQNAHLTTLLGDDRAGSCISSDVSLEHFLQHAWRAWQNHSEERRARLRGAVNFYPDMLSATFPTQSLAFTTMYMERFRELFVGHSELLGGSKSRKKKIASELREALRKGITSSQKLSDSEKDTLRESLRRNPGKINDLFRKSFRESLLELYDMFDLNVDEKELGEFIEQRDAVLHGSWDSGRGGTLDTYRLAQYSLNLLEMLLLRLFEYEGKYFNRVNLSTQDFPPGTADWQ